MKRIAVLLIMVFAAGCEKPRPAAPPPEPQSLADLESPRDLPPPVQAIAFDKGYEAGATAGEAAAKFEKAEHPRKRALAPGADVVAGFAADAAGADAARGEKWRRGFVAGFRDGFARIADGKQ